MNVSWDMGARPRPGFLDHGHFCALLHPKVSAIKGAAPVEGQIAMIIGADSQP
jgi:hypothetical protein